MLDGIAATLTVDRLVWLVPAAILAGLVRGFTGFGSALVYVPLAARVLSPSDVVLSIIVMDLLGPLPLIGPAIRASNRPEAMRLALGALVGAPLGVWLLRHADPTAFRWIASILALLFIGLLAGGFRFRRPPGLRLASLLGVFGGAMGGFAGLAGPPVLLFYLGGSNPPASIRANLILYLATFTLIGLAAFAANGLMNAGAVVLGVLLAGAYLPAILVGSRLFHAFGDAHFRWIAYILVGAAAIAGLPVFGGGT